MTPVVVGCARRGQVPWDLNVGFNDVRMPLRATAIDKLVDKLVSLGRIDNSPETTGHVKLMLHAFSNAGNLHATLRRIKDISLMESPTDEEIAEGADALTAVMWTVEPATIVFDDVESEVYYKRLDTSAANAVALQSDHRCTASAVHNAPDRTVVTLDRSSSSSSGSSGSGSSGSGGSSSSSSSSSSTSSSSSR
eukprot:1171945-Pyramimonas_sp.AAC.1